MSTDVQHPASTSQLRIARRTLLIGGGAAAAGLIVTQTIRRALREPQNVFIAKGQNYDGRLEQTIRDGLLAA